MTLLFEKELRKADILYKRGLLLFVIIKVF